MIKFEIVKRNDKYAIRKTVFWIFRSYQDLKEPLYFWADGNTHYKYDCWSTDIELVKKIFNETVAIEEVVE
jgi:hypothetical protein